MITMDNKIIEHLYKKKELLFYIRTHPQWYKVLNRHPKHFNKFIKIAKEDLQITVQHKLERFKNQVELFSLLNEYMNR